MAESSDQLKPAPVLTEQLRGHNPPWLATPRRRSRGLLAAKIGLPLVAAVTLGYLTYWWYVHNRESVITVQTQENAVPGEPIVTVDNFKYSSVDDKNRPYTITATTATQPQSGNQDTITLTKPQADINLENNAWMAVTAKKGLYHRNADLVDLSGDVTLFHDNGMSFRTATAHVDLKAKIAAGNDPVEGQNQDWELTSQGFRVLNNGNLIIFTGRSHMTLFGKAKDGNG